MKRNASRRLRRRTGWRRESVVALFASRLTARSTTEASAAAPSRGAR